MTCAAEQTIAKWGDEYMLVKALQVGLTGGGTARGWQPKPYQTQLFGNFEMQFERVVFRHDSRRLQLPAMRRSLINMVASKVVEEHLFTPFKACDFCGDRVVCEMEERCLR